MDGSAPLEQKPFWTDTSRAQHPLLNMPNLSEVKLSLQDKEQIKFVKQEGNQIEMLSPWITKGRHSGGKSVLLLNIVLKRGGGDLTGIQ